MIEHKPVEKLRELIGQCGYPKKYRKKPIVIEAIELREQVKIKTREGVLVGYVGDFLIEGIEGEIYPCGREIFFKTYEEAKPMMNGFKEWWNNISFTKQMILLGVGVGFGFVLGRVVTWLV